MDTRQAIRTGRHCVFNLHAHLVFVTKYRRHVLDDAAIDALKPVMGRVCLDAGAELIEMDGEDDHVHLLVNYPPSISLSTLVNSLKGVSSRMLRQIRPDIARRYWKGALWSPSYFAGSCGGAPIEIVRRYVEEQRTKTATSHRDVDTLDLPPDPPASGESVVVFYDCEFTDLTPDSDLLSIAFTACDFEAELYIEISDAEVHRSSDFVKEVVLPLFGQHHPQVLRRTGAAARIEEWLDDLRDGNRQRQIIMLSDSTWDWQHLLELFITMPGEALWAKTFNVVGRYVSTLFMSGRQSAAFDEELELYFRQHPGRHHALVDARGLKAAYWGSRFS